MPAQARIGDTFSTGHLCDTTSTIAGGSTNVLANNKGASRLGDNSVSHDIMVNNVCVPHVVPITSGSPSVVINSKKAARVGDTIDAGSITSGSPDVILDSGKEAIVVLYPEVFFDTPLGLTREHQDDIKAGIGDVAESEPAEYGDGGISAGDGEYNKPNTDIEDVEGPRPTEGQDDIGFPRAEGAGLIFLPHTDPRIKPELRDILVEVAKEFGQDLTITSAYRSPDYNKKVKGAKNSLHQQGLAVDVVQTGLSTQQRQRFIRIAYDKGIRGIGVYNTFTHLDIGNKRAWGAPNSYRYLYKFPWAQDTLRPLGYRVE